MYFSVCASSVFQNIPLDEALESIARAGVRYYEFWSWWDQDIGRVQEAQNRLGLCPAGMCTGFIPLTDPAHRDEYLESLSKTISVCQRLGCRTIISQVGNELPDRTRSEQHHSIVDGLREAAGQLAQTDITLVVEPLNTKLNHKGYYLDRSAEAYQIIDEVASPNVKVLFDLYHQYIMDDLNIADIIRNIAKIGHFHSAGYPGRNEPMVLNEIDYNSIFTALGNAGYSGSVGMEYFPKADPLQSLKDTFAAVRKYEY